MLGFCFYFFKKKIQLAAGTVIIQLLVPKRVISLAKPLCDSAEVLCRKVLYCRLDFLNPVHPLKDYRIGST